MVDMLSFQKLDMFTNLKGLEVYAHTPFFVDTKAFLSKQIRHR